MLPLGSGSVPTRCESEGATVPRSRFGLGLNRKPVTRRAGIKAIRPSLRMDTNHQSPCDALVASRAVVFS